MEKRLVDFCRDNGSVAVYAQVKRHKAPFLTGEYCEYHLCFSRHIK